MNIMVLNSHMFGAIASENEYVDWSAPDTFSVEEFETMIGDDIATYAETNPHMIVWFA